MQGAVTAACMVATAAVQADKHPLPQTLLVQCPADIRQQVTLPVLRGQSASAQAMCMLYARPAGLLAYASKTDEDATGDFSVTAGVGKMRMTPIMWKGSPTA